MSTTHGRYDPLEVIKVWCLSDSGCGFRVTFCCAMLCISAAYAALPSVQVSVTFVYCVETSKTYSQFFSTVGYLIADRRHSLFGHICRLPENTPASQALQLSIEAHTSTPPAATGSARRVVHEEIGCNKWKKTLAYLLVLPGSRARIVRCGGRYDPQLVKRSSEWVSLVPHHTFSVPNVMAIFRRGPYNRASNAGGAWKNRDFRPISQFISETI